MLNVIFSLAASHFEIWFVTLIASVCAEDH